MKQWMVILCLLYHILFDEWIKKMDENAARRERKHSDEQFIIWWTSIFFLSFIYNSYMLLIIRERDL